MAAAKWILGGLGFVLGGPIGAIIGVVIGSLFEGGTSWFNGLPESDDEDTSRSGSYREQSQSGRSTQSSHSSRATAGDVRVSYLVLIACVMKADGHVLKSEVNFIKPYLIKLYGEEGAKQALQLLKKLLEQDIDYVSVCGQMKQYINYSIRLEMLHLLLDLANADGDFAESERAMIERIGICLGISRGDYNSLESLYKKTKDPHWAYTVLEIEETASDEEVKKAYRRMAMKFHPDKVANAGEEMRQKATEKFRAINEAYEHVKLLRNMK